MAISLFSFSHSSNASFAVTLLNLSLSSGHYDLQLDDPEVVPIFTPIANEAGVVIFGQAVTFV